MTITLMKKREGTMDKVNKLLKLRDDLRDFEVDFEGILSVEAMKSVDHIAGVLEQIGAAFGDHLMEKWII